MSYSSLARDLLEFLTSIMNNSLQHEYYVAKSLCHETLVTIPRGTCPKKGNIQNVLTT